MACGCGSSVQNPEHAFHVKSARHTAWLKEKPDKAPEEPPEEAPEPVKAKLEDDFQAAVNLWNRNTHLPALTRAQEAAKAIRKCFSARFWPNESHPGTVLDFMNEHGITAFYGPRPSPMVDGEEQSKE